MLGARARLIFAASLSLACARADASASADPEPIASEPSAPPPAGPTAAEVCEHAWALLSTAMADQPVPDLQAFLDICVADLETQRQVIGEDEHQRRAACQLAAADLPELYACVPRPEPAATEREPASFPEDAELRPLSTVMDNAIYSPNPDIKELQDTKAARFDKADGVGIVGYCVDTHGATTDIHTVQKFPGDPQIDQILRDTIARWRFKPFIVDGAVVKVCTEKTFVLRFK